MIVGTLELAGYIGIKGRTVSSFSPRVQAKPVKNVVDRVQPSHTGHRTGHSTRHQHGRQRRSRAPSPANTMRRSRVKACPRERTRPCCTQRCHSPWPRDAHDEDGPARHSSQPHAHRRASSSSSHPAHHVPPPYRRPVPVRPHVRSLVAAHGPGRPGAARSRVPPIPPAAPSTRFEPACKQNGGHRLAAEIHLPSPTHACAS